MNGVDSFCGTDLPNKPSSLVILSSTRLTISPRYSPEIVFSKICQVIRRGPMTLLLDTLSEEHLNNSEDGSKIYLLTWIDGSCIHFPVKLG